MEIFILIAEAIVLTFTLSIDTFVCGLAYGANKIRVPFKSLIAINFVCSAILGISLLFGVFIGSYIDNAITTILSVGILIILGLSKIFDSFIKNLIKKHNGINKDIEFSIFNIKLTLNLYAKPENADFDRSKVISIKEALALALALSIDSLTIGFGAGLKDMSGLKGSMIIFLSFLIGMIAIILGTKIGGKIATKVSANITWISGLLLIIMAILKLVGN